MAGRCYCCSCDAASVTENSVVLRGIGKDVDLEMVKLFLESPRFCPNGGDVRDIERISEDSALVTFCYSQVATGLIGKSLPMPDGTEVCIQSTKTISHVQHSDPCVDDNSTERSAPTRWLKDDSSGSIRNSFNGSSSSESDEDGHTDNRTGDAKETNRNRGNADDGEHQSRSNERLEERKAWTGSKRIGDSKHNRAKDFKETRDAETQIGVGSDQKNVHTKHPEVEEISFGLEKLRLIQLAVDLKSEPFSDVRFDETRQTVTIRGTKDEIDAIALQLYEIANSSVHDAIHFPQQDTENLTLSARVESWLNEEFSNRQLPAVCCNIGDTPSILAKDKDTLESAAELLLGILVMEKIDFDASQRAYLQSEDWAEYVDDVESSRIVSMTTDESSSVVMVTGCASDVSDCAKEVREQIRDNASTTRDIKCERRVACLLKSQKNAIMAEVSQVASSTVQLDFDVEEGLIKLSGLQSDLKETVKLIEENFINAVRHATYEVNILGLTTEMFTNQLSAGCDLVNLLELKHSCVIEVREQSGQREDSSQSQRRPRRDAIKVVQGDIAKFEMADVLVNTVGKTEGSVTRSFRRVGGEQLHKDLKHTGMPRNFGSDVIATRAFGELKAKFIFHAAMGDNRNEESINRMCRLITKCLEMAAKHEAKSIAFPTLGCGRHGFDPSQVVDCLQKAIEKSKCDFAIFVIAQEDNIARKFRSLIAQTTSSESCSALRGKIAGRGGRRSDGRKSVIASNAVAFHISALSDDVIREVKEGLRQRISNLTEETPIHEKAIAKLSHEAVSSIRKLQSSHVSIEIDKENKTITVKGEKSAAHEARSKILSIIYKDSAKRIGQNDSNRVPEYWSKCKSLRHVRRGSMCERVRLSPRSVWHKEVSRLVMKTWEDDKVGQGSDAAGLGPHRIRIRNIFCIENPRLYSRYATKKQVHCLSANYNPCPKINQLQNERQVRTSSLKLRHLEATLSGKVNECFLLHGTKEDIVDSIQTEGLDSRLSGTDAMFGVGTYFTESSTKADQYADSKQQRLPDGRSMYMYVCRVLLGSPFICQTPERFRRPPCRKRGCFSDACTVQSHHSVGSFDSVIGTHKANNTRLLFREFIIYHPDQSYPDFLVEYERKSL